MSTFKSRLLVVVVVLAVLIAGGLFFYISQFGGKRTITIGALFDMTGATSDVGVDYSLGVKDAVRWINDHGGINNRKIDLVSNDYGYDVSKAKNLYRQYTRKMGIELIQGWGTGDTEALMPEVNKDGVVYMSASYSAALTDPFYTPFNFFVGTDYSTSIRLAIKYIKETHADPTRPARMIFIYPDHPYGTAPIPAGKRMAAELGVEYGQDQLVALSAKGAIDQLVIAKEYDPDWVWLGGTLNSCAVVIRDAGKVGLDTKFIMNTWGFDERLAENAGPYADGRAYGVVPCAIWGDDVPGMKDIIQAHRRYRSAESHTIHFVKGWLSMMVMAEGLRRADGNTDGRSVRNALETLRDFDVGGLSSPITYTEKDHRPNTALKIYKIEGGEFKQMTQIGMPRDSRFIGW